MYGSMVDIQSVTAEIRRGKKKETGPKYNVHICYAGRFSCLLRRAAWEERRPILVSAPLYKPVMYLLTLTLTHLLTAPGPTSGM